MTWWNDRGALLPGGLKADQIELIGDMVLVHSSSSSAAAACPRCGVVSRHVHSRYRRRADLPAHGCAVSLVLIARRFRCRSARCPTRIFAERFDAAVTEPHARRTTRLQGQVRHLGLALGGRPAQALAGRLLLPVSKDTFLRSARGCTVTENAAPPRVIGIDDWAWRRGQRYGTLICDLEKRRVIDLLPDWECAATATGFAASRCRQSVAKPDLSANAGALGNTGKSAMPTRRSPGGIRRRHQE